MANVRLAAVAAWALVCRARAEDCKDDKTGCIWVECHGHYDKEEMWHCQKTCELCDLQQPSFEEANYTGPGTRAYAHRLETPHQVLGHEPDGNTVAKAISAFVIGFPCLLFSSMYFLQSSEPKVRAAMWEMLSGMVSLLLAVVITQCGIAFVEFQVVAGTPPMGFGITLTEELMASIAFLFLCLSMLVLNLGGYKLGDRFHHSIAETDVTGQICELKAFTSLLGHLCGFAGVHAFGALYNVGCRHAEEEHRHLEEEHGHLEEEHCEGGMQTSPTIYLVGLGAMASVLMIRGFTSYYRYWLGGGSSFTSWWEETRDHWRPFVATDAGGRTSIVAGQADNREVDHWVEMVVEGEDDAFSLTFGFLALQVSMWSIQGKMLPLEVETEKHSGQDIWRMSYRVMVSVLLVVVLTIGRALFVPSPKNHTLAWYRSVTVVYSSIGMWGAWTLIFTSMWIVRNWLLFLDSQMPTTTTSAPLGHGHHRLLHASHEETPMQKWYSLEQVLNACLMTLLALILTISFVYLEGFCLDMNCFKGVGVGKTLRQFIVFAAFLVGVSWDKAFAAADQTIVNSTPFLKHHHVISKAAIGILLPVLIYPAWVRFIVPRAMLKPGGEYNDLEMTDSHHQMSSSSHAAMIEMEIEKNWSSTCMPDHCRCDGEGSEGDEETDVVHTDGPVLLVSSMHPLLQPQALHVPVG